MNKEWHPVKLGELLEEVSRPESVIKGKVYHRLGMRWYSLGLFDKDHTYGRDIKAPKVYRVEEGDFVYNRLFAWKGSFGTVSPKDSGKYVSNEFPCFTIDSQRLDPYFLWYYFSRRSIWSYIKTKSSGTSRTSRLRFKQADFLKIQILLPPFEEQKYIVSVLDTFANRIKLATSKISESLKEAKVLRIASAMKVFEELAKIGCPNSNLDDVADIIMGQSPPGKSYNDRGEGIPLLNGPTEFGPEHPIPIQWTTSPTRICQIGDILICVRGATTGKMNWADQDYCIGRGLASIRAKEDVVLPKYLYAFVETQTQYILSKAKGTTFPNLQGIQLRRLSIPVPDINKQELVVKFISNLQAESEGITQHFEWMAENFSVLFEKTVDDAIRGKLEVNIPQEILNEIRAKKLLEFDRQRRIREVAKEGLLEGEEQMEDIKVNNPEDLTALLSKLTMNRSRKVSAKELWQMSELDSIDVFYSFLKREFDENRIVEKRDGYESYLEIAYENQPTMD